MSDSNTTIIETETDNTSINAGYEYLKYIGGRKFTFAFCICLFSTVLLIISMIDKEIWKTVVLGVSSMYMISNVIQKQIEKEK